MAIISNPDTIDWHTGGSGSGSGEPIPKGCENCDLEEECAVVYKTTDNPSIIIDRDGIPHFGPIDPKPGDKRTGTLIASSEHRCVPPCNIDDVPPPPPPDVYGNVTQQCATCVNGQWFLHDPVQCVIPATRDGYGAHIKWPPGTSAKTHEWDTTFKGCPKVILVIDKISGGVVGLDGKPTPEVFGEPGAMYINPECPCNRKRNIPGTPTQSSIFEIIRSQAGVTSKPVIDEPSTPQPSIFSLVSSQATPVTTVASLSIQQQQSAPMLMMAQNVGTQSDGGGGLKCSVASVSYTSDVTPYNTGYENSDEIVDTTTSYIKGYIDYTLSTDTITVIEPKL